MAGLVDALVRLLEVEQVSDHQFRSRPIETDRQRLYGGQLLAQALMAAGRTVESDRLVHSLHAYFLKSGGPEEPITFDVVRIRGGETFVTCRVVAEQRGRALLDLTASFHVREESTDTFDTMPDVASPPDMVAIDDWVLARSNAADERSLPYYVDAVEFRQHRDTFRRDADSGRGDLLVPTRDVWARVVGRLPDSPLLHMCVIAYLSDKPLLGTTVLSPPVNGDSERFVVASLDHAMWFHRPIRADEWMLCHLHSATTGGARALARGEIFRQDGALAVTTVQEGLVRPLGQ